MSTSLRETSNILDSIHATKVKLLCTMVGCFNNPNLYEYNVVKDIPADYPAYLNSALEIDYMNLTDFMNQSGFWTPIYRITPQDTGYPRNHNATLLRDNYGHLQDWTQPAFYFTVSKAAPEVQPSGSSHAEWTYHIWKSKVMKK